MFVKKKKRNNIRKWKVESECTNRWSNRCKPIGQLKLDIFQESTHHNLFGLCSKSSGQRRIQNRQLNQFDSCKFLDRIPNNCLLENSKHSKRLIRNI